MLTIPFFGPYYSLDLHLLSSSDQDTCFCHFGKCDGFCREALEEAATGLTSLTLVRVSSSSLVRVLEGEGSLPFPFYVTATVPILPTPDPSSLLAGDLESKPERGTRAIFLNIWSCSLNSRK